MLEMKKTSSILYAFVMVNMLFIVSCNNRSDNSKQTTTISLEQDLNALTLLQDNCFSCHNPDLEIETRVAPPMFKVRNHYYSDNITKDEFVKNIIRFVNQPTEENSVMPGAVRNFGLMPKQTFKEDDLKIIAGYIYSNDLETDEWYARWDSFKKMERAPMADLSYEDMGQKFANATKAELGKNLLAAIKLYGSAGAVKFCNTRAIPLTDSMAKVNNVTIKRVSDRPRNPANQANETELDYISQLQNNLLNGKNATPKVFEKDGKVIGYYAIETNKMCLQCHGKMNSDILTETYGEINKLYPADKAINYGEKQIRGIWVVEMAKK